MLVILLVLCLLSNLFETDYFLIPLRNETAHSIDQLKGWLYPQVSNLERVYVSIVFIAIIKIIATINI